MSSSEILNAENHCFFKNPEENKYIPTWFVETSREDAEEKLSAKDAGTVLMRGTRPKSRDGLWKYVISSKISSNSTALHYIVKQGRNGFRLDIDETYKPQWVSCLSQVMTFFLDTIGTIKGSRARLYSGPGQIRSGTQGTQVPKDARPHYMPMNQRNGSQHSNSSSIDHDYLQPVDESEHERTRNPNGSDTSSTYSEEYINVEPNPVFVPEPDRKEKSPQNNIRSCKAPDYKNSPTGLSVNEKHCTTKSTVVASCRQKPDYLNAPTGMLITHTNEKGPAAASHGQRILTPVPDYTNTPKDSSKSKVSRINSIEYVNLYEDPKPKNNNRPPGNVNGHTQRPSSPDYAVIDDDYELPNQLPFPSKVQSGTSSSLPRPKNGSTPISKSDKLPVTKSSQLINVFRK